MIEIKDINGNLLLNVDRANLRGANLSGAKLRGADLPYDLELRGLILVVGQFM